MIKSGTIHQQHNRFSKISFYNLLLSVIDGIQWHFQTLKDKSLTIRREIKDQLLGSNKLCHLLIDSIEIFMSE